MTFYWQRCGICGKYYPIDKCFLHPEISVCAYCCLFCGERNQCAKPTWYSAVKPVTREEKERREKKAAEEKIQKVLEELLGKLG
ncbi:MAG: hypothetical protein DRO23_11325 [Thermoprotei archaeon]|nr:MAG: hypothetical protein DRO23_11325 [Thermoprotei archaeon]